MFIRADRVGVFSLKYGTMNVKWALRGSAAKKKKHSKRSSATDRSEPKQTPPVTGFFFLTPTPRTMPQNMKIIFK